jgi:hypothetical protein
MDGDLAFKLAELRGQISDLQDFRPARFQTCKISDLGGAIRQLQRSGLDGASAQLLISRKRAELERLMNFRNAASATHFPSGARG